MKLRLYGNSIRLRLSPSDVETLHRSGRVSEVTHFDQLAEFGYRLETSDQVRQVRAALHGASLVVRLPKSRVEEWSTSDQVSITHQQPLPNGERLNILIEKDFECLHEEQNEPGVELYPNPRRAAVQ